MANAPIDVIPCKQSFPFPSPDSLEANGTSGAYSQNGYWSSIYSNENYNDSNNPLISSFYQLDENLSSTGSEFNLNYSSNGPFRKPMSMQPIDLLISNPICITVTVLSILGNLAMLGVILLTPQFRKPANYLIVNLSLSSLAFIVSANIRMIENGYQTWEFNAFVCRLLAVLHRIPVPCVALTTMMISLDRGRVARNPMNCSSSIRPAWKSVIIWSFSILIVLPLAFTRRYDECTPSRFKCAKIVLFGRPSLSMLYGIAYLLSVHIFPAAILIREAVKTQKLMKFLKLTSVEHIHQQLESAMTPSSSYHNSYNFPDNRLRLLRNSCWFTTIFLVFWVPYGIFQFPLDLPKELLPELLVLYLNFYFRFVRNFTYLQIALNPVILFALSYDLRMYLARVKCDWRGYGMRGGGGGHYHHRHRFHDSRCNRLDHAIRNGNNSFP